MVTDLESGILPFKDDSVDEVIAFEVLEHISNLEQMIEEIYRVMKKGAVFRITVPYKDSILSLNHVQRFDECYFMGWDKDWYQSKEGDGRFQFNFNFETKKLELIGNKIALLLPFRTWRGFFDHLIRGIYIELVKK